MITSHFPPYHLGGYELRCREVLDGLAHKGHKICVITSLKEGQSKSSDQIHPYEIIRKLHIRKKARHFIEEVILDLQDTALLDRQIKRFQPDVIYLGHIMPLSKALMPYLAACKIPIVYDEGGMELIAGWENRGRWFYFIEDYVSRYSILNKIKPLVINIICKGSGKRIKSHWAWPDAMQIVFNSELNLRNTIAKGVPINRFKVVHSGLDFEKFTFIPKTKLASPLLFIVPGRIEPPKGQKDAVRLLAKLREYGIDGNVIIVGEKYSNSYFLEIEHEITKFQLDHKIIFYPMLAQKQLIDLYHQADICFFPSYHKTGYSRVSLEAMACGCIVISYGNEGSDEIIRNQQTGFLVRSEDYQRIAEIIKEIILDPGLFRDILWNARKKVEENSSMQKYVDRIEEIVVNTAGVD